MPLDQQKALLEKSLAAELDELLKESKEIKQNVMNEATGNVRGVKTRILTEVVSPKAMKFKVPGLSSQGLRILLTEYLFKAVK
mgnify:CR=1 FL=1